MFWDVYPPQKTVNILIQCTSCEVQLPIAAAARYIIRATFQGLQGVSSWYSKDRFPANGVCTDPKELSCSFFLHHRDKVNISASSYLSLFLRGMCVSVCVCL